MALDGGKFPERFEVKPRPFFAVTAHAMFPASLPNAIGHEDVARAGIKVFRLVAAEHFGRNLHAVPHARDMHAGLQHAEKEWVRGVCVAMMIEVEHVHGAGHPRDGRFDVAPGRRAEIWVGADSVPGTRRSTAPPGKSPALK